MWVFRSVKKTGMVLDQSDYVRDMEKRPFSVDGARAGESILGSGEMSQYRVHIDAIN